MSTFTLQPNSNYAVPVTLGLLSSKLRYEVESEFPTATLVMDSPNTLAFRSGQAYTSYHATMGQTYHKGEVQLPSGIYYLVIVNFGATPTAVHFKLWA